MIELQSQVAVVTQASKRLPLRSDQKKAISAAILTLQKLDNLRTKLVKSTEEQSGDFDDIAHDLCDLLGLETVPVVKAYGDGKHAPVPQG
jgi:hypothetical protein